MYERPSFSPGVDVTMQRKEIFAILRSTVIVMFLVPVTLLLGIISIARKNRNGAGVGALWARICLRIAGGRVKVHDLDHLDLRQNYVFVSNHQSMFDILVIMGYLPFSFCWVAKKELFSVPFFGKCMESIGSIPLDRKDRRSAMHSMDMALERVRKGASITVFPEGTRSRDGKIARFKQGAFHVALKSGKPVVPLLIKGTGRMMSPGSFGTYPCTMELFITPPIHIGNMHLTKNELAKLTRQRIVATREQYG
jgi:1-acyl-sn-glycerol-3-phosphate acyltransferase